MKWFRGLFGLGFGIIFLIAAGLSTGVWENTTAVFAQESADLNSDMIVNAKDLLMLQEQWMTNGDVTTDPASKPQAEVLSVTVPVDLRPEIMFTLEDANGLPLPTAGLTIRWILAKVVVDNALQNRSHYESYTTRTVSNAVGNATPGTVTATQATYDAGGTLTDLGNGQYQYKFGTVITGYDPSLTHTAGAQIERRVSGAHAITPLNPLFTFRPDGGEVTLVRELSDTITCNQCHDRLELHGGGRREFGLCILCHNPAEGNIDPDSGNTIDMANMIHKIHRGVNLPSVQSGTPYVIYGNSNSLHDYSHVVFPQDIRNCIVCHTGPQADYHQQVPSRRACGACHDNVDFETGQGHSENNLAQANDNSCSGCHPATGNGFGGSVADSHIPPKKRDGFPHWTGQILNIANAVPGMTPEVTFSLLKEVSGATSVIAYPTEANRIGITIAPLNVDYSDHRTDTASAANLTDHGDGTFTMTLSQPLSASAEGTYAFGLESRGISQGEDYDNARPSLMSNPVQYVAVTGTAVPRRQIVDLNKCNVCHDVLTLHGDNRVSAEYCVLCHRPGESDIDRRPAGSGDPVPIDFKFMIHKIHTGEDLANPYTVYGFGNTPHDYTEVLYPGDRRTCEQCHLPGTYNVPAPMGALDTRVVNATDVVVFQEIPETAACTACHDSNDSLMHAHSAEVIVGLPGGGENCAACHGVDASESVMEVHKKGL